MKMKKLKGFTLIELIVVMAIFSIVIAAAVQLMQPAGKMLTLAQVREEGNAAVSIISKYIEGEMSSAEYVMPVNYIPTDDGEMLVKGFVKKYYEGIVVPNTDPASVDSDSFGKGIVHVMIVDNADKGRIKDVAYTVSYNVGGNCILSSTTTDAINKAYYDQYSYVICPGTATSNFVDFMKSFKASNTSFTIDATTTRGTGVNEKTYTFSTTAATPLINIFERGSVGVRGKYFVMNYIKETDATTGNVTWNPEIVDICSNVLKSQKDLLAINDITSAAEVPYLRTSTGGLSTVDAVNPYVDPAITADDVKADGFCIIYSIGFEQLI